MAALTVTVWQSELDGCQALPPVIPACGKLARKPYVPASEGAVKLLLKLPFPLLVVVVSMGAKPSGPHPPERTCNWIVCPSGTAGLDAICPEKATFVCPRVTVLEMGLSFAAVVKV